MFLFRNSSHYIITSFLLSFDRMLITCGTYSTCTCFVNVHIPKSKWKCVIAFVLRDTVKHFMGVVSLLK